MLSQLTFKASYRTGREDILREFYIPSLSESCQYDRAVGYFSSSILSYAAQGISAFFRSNSGRMRLIFGGEISSDDLDAILKGSEHQRLSDLLDLQFDEAISRLVSEIDRRRLELLSMLVATGRLDIRFAFRRLGMFHDKFGIFLDDQGNAVAFQGSANESAAGLVQNYERIFVHRSWTEDGIVVVNELRDEFELLWSGREQHCVVLPLPEAARRSLLALQQSSSFAIISQEEEAAIASADKIFGGNHVTELDPERAPKLPTLYKGHPYGLHQHQRSALESWRANGARGILELCTGAGKTVTAAHCIVSMVRFRPFVLISAPYINLAEQWCQELSHFNIAAIRAWSGTGWRETLVSAINSYELRARDFCCVIVVNATLLTEEFRQIIDGVSPASFLYVADEVHHLRNSAVKGLLPIAPRWRMGLSATPYHYIDESGNSALRKYFGDIAFTYGLAKALENKILTPYHYYPTLVELTNDEAAKYRSLSAQIAGFSDDSFAQGNPVLEQLFRKRAELIATAENKLILFASLVGGRRPVPTTLVYCGIDAEVDGEMRQIDEVVKILSTRGWRPARYTSRESQRVRLANMESFAHGAIDALVAMKCLDEGVDIPACRVAYILASSRDPRQFIQRRGRLLRRSPGKEFAEIYDFIVVTPLDSEVGTSDRTLVRAEFSRALEFANLSENRVDALSVLEPVARSFDLVHVI